MLQVTIVLIVCGSLLTFSNASLLASDAAQRPQQNRHGKPRPGKPEGSLPDLEDVQRESLSERQPAPPIPSTIRSPKVPLEPWNGRRVGDPGTRGELGQAMNRTKRAHASRRAPAPPPVLDDQFIANFFAWALVRTPGGTEATFWNDQLRVAYAQGQTSLKLTATKFAPSSTDILDVFNKLKDQTGGGGVFVDVPPDKFHEVIPQEKQPVAGGGGLSNYYYTDPGNWRTRQRYSVVFLRYINTANPFSVKQTPYMYVLSLIHELTHNAPKRFRGDWENLQRWRNGRCGKNPRSKDFDQYVREHCIPRRFWQESVGP